MRLHNKGIMAKGKMSAPTRSLKQSIGAKNISGRNAQPVRASALSQRTERAFRREGRMASIPDITTQMIMMAAKHRSTVKMESTDWSGCTRERPSRMDDRKTVLKALVVS